MPVIVPDTSTGLLIVTPTPGVTPPCSSVARTRMLPVCTCAEAGAAEATSDSAARNVIRLLMQILLRIAPM